MISREEHIKFLCGLSVEKCNMFHTDAIIYPDCKSNRIRSFRITDLSYKMSTFTTPWLFKSIVVAIVVDIEACRIHVKRFIDFVRDLSILDSVCLEQRMNILSSIWQSLCHIVNIASPPIEPKVEK